MSQLKRDYKVNADAVTTMKYQRIALAIESLLDIGIMLDDLTATIKGEGEQPASTEATVSFSSLESFLDSGHTVISDLRESFEHKINAIEDAIL